METTEPAPTQEEIALCQKWVKIGQLAQGISWLSGIFSLIVFFFVIDHRPAGLVLKLVVILVYLIGVAGSSVSLAVRQRVLLRYKGTQNPGTWKILGKDMLASDEFGLKVLLVLPMLFVFLAPAVLSSSDQWQWLLLGLFVSHFAGVSPASVYLVKNGSEDGTRLSKRKSLALISSGIVCVIFSLGLLIILVRELFV